MPTQRSLDFNLAEATSRERFGLVLSAWEQVKAKAAPSPLVGTVARLLLGWIHDGGGAEGLQRSAADLAKRFDVEPHTIRKALRLLVAAGLVERQAVYRNDGSQAANVLRIRWAGVLAIAVYRDEVPLSPPAPPPVPADIPPCTGRDRAPVPAGAPPLYRPVHPFPTPLPTPSSAPPTGAEGEAAAAEDAREWEGAKRELLGLGLSAPKIAETFREAKLAGYRGEEVRLLVAILADAMKAGQIRGPGAIVARLQAPPGSPPRKLWPVDLDDPPPRRAGSLNTPELLAERRRSALIDHLEGLGLSRLEAIDEADRRLAMKSRDAKQEARA